MRPDSTVQQGRAIGARVVPKFRPRGETGGKVVQFAGEAVGTLHVVQGLGPTCQAWCCADERRSAAVGADDDLGAAVAGHVRRGDEDAASPLRRVHEIELRQLLQSDPAPHLNVRTVPRAGRGHEVRQAVAIDIAERDAHAAAQILRVRVERFEFLPLRQIEEPHLRAGAGSRPDRDDRFPGASDIRRGDEDAELEAAFKRQKLGDELQIAAVEDADERRHPLAGGRDDFGIAVAGQVRDGNVNPAAEPGGHRQKTRRPVPT